MHTVLIEHRACPRCANGRTTQRWRTASPAVRLARRPGGQPPTSTNHAQTATLARGIAAQPEPSSDIPARLRQLAEVRESGAITAAAFETKKQELLAHL